MGKKTKTKRFSLQGFDNKHYRTTQQYVNAVDALFDRATVEIAKVASKSTYDPDKAFSFDDYPQTKAKVQSITASLANNITSVVERGSRKQWLFACQKNDDFVTAIMDTSKLSKARLNKMQDRNLDALQTFQERKVNGMELSKRVWQYVGQYKDQIELGIDVGVGDGRSAQQLARDLKKNLVDPDRLFRRVRDKRGNLQLSQSAKAFHPGQGVYRSSVKNAQRLTRSEINMAYREADWLRWQQLDFVVGFEVKTSERHEEWLRNVWNKKNKGKVEICDQLKGRYPKTFKFKGWHPQCMCYCVPILMDEETFDDQELSDLKSALKGTEYKKLEAKNGVKDVPQGFKDWVDTNTEKQEKWSSTPYFIKDNFKGGVLANGLKNVAVKPIEPTRTLLSDMPEEEVQQWRSQWKIIENEFENIVHEFQKQGINYSFLEDLIGDALHTPRKESKYWRIDEAKAELLRLKKELKEKERQILQAVQVEFDNAIKELRNWVYFGDVQEAIDKKNPQLARTLIASKLAEKKRLQAEYNADILEAQNTIKEARKLKLDTTDLQSWLDYAKSDQREWIMGKAKFKQAVNSLKTLIAKQNGVQLKTDYSDNDTINETFKEINDTMNPGERWFEHGDLRIGNRPASGSNGSTNMRGSINLTPTRLNLCKSAMAKIGKGLDSTITFEEADAMGTMWHEIVHNRNIIGNMYSTKLQTRFMELANEFVARHTLDEFYGVLGCKTTPHPEFMTNRASTGYNKMVTNYDFVISKLGLDFGKVLGTVRKHLYTARYDSQQDGLKQGLIDGGIHLLEKDRFGNFKPLKTSTMNALMKLIKDQEDVTPYDWGTGKYGAKITKEEAIIKWLQENGLLAK